MPGLAVGQSDRLAPDVSTDASVLNKISTSVPGQNANQTLLCADGNALQVLAGLISPFVPANRCAHRNMTVVCLESVALQPYSTGPPWVAPETWEWVPDLANTSGRLGT